MLDINTLTGRSNETTYWENHLDTDWKVLQGLKVEFSLFVFSIAVVPSLALDPMQPISPTTLSFVIILLYTKIASYLKPHRGIQKNCNHKSQNHVAAITGSKWGTANYGLSGKHEIWCMNLCFRSTVSTVLKYGNCCTIMEVVGCISKFERIWNKQIQVTIDQQPCDLFELWCQNANPTADLWSE